MADDDIKEFDPLMDQAVRFRCPGINLRNTFVLYGPPSKGCKSYPVFNIAGFVNTMKPSYLCNSTTNQTSSNQTFKICREFGIKPTVELSRIHGGLSCKAVTPFSFSNLAIYKRCMGIIDKSFQHIKIIDCRSNRAEPPPIIFDSVYCRTMKHRMNNNMSFAVIGMICRITDIVMPVSLAEQACRRIFLSRSSQEISIIKSLGFCKGTEVFIQNPMGEKICNNHGTYDISNLIYRRYKNCYISDLVSSATNTTLKCDYTRIIRLQDLKFVKSANITCKILLSEISVELKYASCFFGLAHDIIPYEFGRIHSGKPAKLARPTSGRMMGLNRPR